MANARATGVEQIIIIGLDLANSQQSCLVAERFDLKFTAGVHPAEAGGVAAGDLDCIGRLLDHPRCVAVGEIGLDFHYEDAPSEAEQRHTFIQMIHLANAHQKPVVIHQRDAAEQLLDVLESYPVEAGGVFHCFSGDVEYAERVVAMGYYISLAGNVTYKKSNLLEVARVVPVERLLVETDAPYLSPVPHRGRRNEPAYVEATLCKVAEVRGTEPSVLADIVMRNAIRLFGLLQ